MEAVGLWEGAILFAGNAKNYIDYSILQFEEKIFEGMGRFVRKCFLFWSKRLGRELKRGSGGGIGIRERGRIG